MLERSSASPAHAVASRESRAPQSAASALWNSSSILVQRSAVIVIVQLLSPSADTHRVLTRGSARKGPAQANPPGIAATLPEFPPKVTSHVGARQGE